MKQGRSWGECLGPRGMRMGRGESSTMKNLNEKIHKISYIIFYHHIIILPYSKLYLLLTNLNFSTINTNISNIYKWSYARNLRFQSKTCLLALHVLQAKVSKLHLDNVIVYWWHPGLSLSWSSGRISDWNLFWDYNSLAYRSPGHKFSSSLGKHFGYEYIKLPTAKLPDNYKLLLCNEILISRLPNKTFATL